MPPSSTTRICVGTRAFPTNASQRAAGRPDPPDAPSRLLLVYTLSFDASSQAASTARLELESTCDVGTSSDPGSLCFHPSDGHLYFNDESNHEVGACKLIVSDPSAGLSLSPARTSAGGRDCCYSVIDPSGSWLLVANYGDGSVAVLPIDPDTRLPQEGDERISHGSFDLPLVEELQDRQEGPHAHQALFDPWTGGRWVLVCDLGLDRVFVYEFDNKTGKFSRRDPTGHFHGAQGSGPRHLAFHPTQPLCFVLNELNGTMTTLRVDVTAGKLTEVGTVRMLPEQDVPSREHHSGGSGICISPDGRFVYGVNRNKFERATIAAFAVEAETGELRLVAHELTRGTTPRDLVLVAGGRFLVVAHQDSNSVSLFERDGETGRLAYVHTADAPAPCCCVRPYPGSQ